MHSQPSASPDAPPPLVMIIDDDPDTCETIGDVLRLKGHAVRVATRGGPALELLAAEPADAAIVDLRLPDISGLELLEALKALSPATEVIFITGHASMHTAIEAVNGSAYAYLVKPFEMEHLVATLGKALERRGLTRALRQSEEQYRLVTENILDAVFLLDIEGRPVLGNPRAEALSDQRQDELRRTDVFSLLVRDGAREVMARMTAAPGAAPAPTFFETGLIRRDGAVVPVEASLTRVMKEGRPTGHLLVARDITERKRSEEALGEMNQRLTALVQASPLAIWSERPDGVVTTWNAAAERIFGWSAAEAVGRPFAGTPADRRGEAAALLARAMAGETVAGIETSRLRADGAAIDVSVALAPLRSAAGAITSAVVIAADITNRLQLEEQLRQSQKLEAIGSLAGGIAHDFNNLLTVIGGRSQIMRWRLPPDDPLLEDIETIESATDRAAGLTRQLLAFSRKQHLEMRVLDLNAITAELDGMLRRLIGEHIEVVTRPSAGLGHVRADATQIEQVLFNLAVNARDAMPSGGRLTIETQNVDLAEQYTQAHLAVPAGRYVMLAVTDSGCGMDAATQARIFEPFFTTKEPGRGTGLGLATVYGIVKQSGGHIWVYSEVGIGTTFKIYLPRVDEAADALPAISASSVPRGGTETILLAEDDDGVRALVRATLESRGYTVLVAPRPAEAIRIARDHDGPIHLVLSDVVMPEMTGPALVERLGALRPDAKIILMSGYPADAIPQHGSYGSEMPLLHKPFTPGGLAHRVRDVLDGTL